jgi:hypothetical protein
MRALRIVTDDRQGREYLIGLLHGIGLTPSVDGAGNISARRPGSGQVLAFLVIGSHVDSVPQGGNYDGIVGSLGAIEVAPTLAKNHIALRHLLDVPISKNEEGDLKGSRAISGELREEELTRPRAVARRSGMELRSVAAILRILRMSVEKKAISSRVWNCTSSRVPAWRRTRSTSAWWRESSAIAAGM